MNSQANMTFDKDLTSIQESRFLAANAHTAAQEMAMLTPEQAWEITEAVAAAAVEKATDYAQWAVDETSMGNVHDKTLKNQNVCSFLLNYYRNVQLGGMRPNSETNAIEVAQPAGVVMGLVASTSPIATLYFKVLISLMTRNVLILSPHPISAACTAHATDYLHDVAVRAGAPKNCIQIQRHLSLSATEKLMADSRIKVIVATGGSPMVRAAYSSGRPALGVGPGNVPVIIDEGVNLNDTAESIIGSKNFDHGSPCNSESTVIPLASIGNKFGQALKAKGAHLCNPQETQKLRDYAYPKGQFNAAIVGKPSSWIAQKAGFNVAKDTTALVVYIDQIGAKVEPFSKEKLSPILAFHTANDRDHAISIAQQSLLVSGLGHTAAIHTLDKVFATQAGIALDVNRIVVNMPAIESGGNSLRCGLAPTFTIGTGYGSGSSIAENVGPLHLIQWKNICFDMTSEIQIRAEACASTSLQDHPETLAQVKQLVRDELARNPR